MKKKISILCSNLANNALGRSYLLASMLKDEFSVEILGPLYAGQEIWEPLRTDTTVQMTPCTISNPPKSYQEIRNFYNQIDGDIIYANKTYFFSVGLGLIKKIKSKTPLVVDIDDWDLGFSLYRLRNMCLKNVPKYWYRWFCQLPRFYESNRPASMFLYERLAGFADDITVSNTYLQKRFGGHLIPHVRDTSVLSPEKYDSRTLRQKWRIPGHLKIVAFIGTPRIFKGIEDLIEAILMIDDPNLALMIVGLDSRDLYTTTIESKAAALQEQKRLLLFGQQPLELLPEFLAVSDMIAIPQRKCLATVGQVPAKVFDAMAMEKAIVATAVSDLPAILEECGWIVEPKNPADLCSAIKAILEDRQTAELRGKKARLKCINEYDTEVYRAKLAHVFMEVTNKIKTH